MTAYVLHDAQGEPRSIATGLAPSPAPGGLTAKVLTDAEFTGLTCGSHRWDVTTRTVMPDAARAQLSANHQAVLDFITQAAPTLQAIVDTPTATFTNVGGAQAAVRGLQGQVKDIAGVLRRLGRLAINDFTGAD